MRLGPFLFSLMLSTAAFAAETRSFAPGAGPATASVTDLAWMAGEWEGEGLGGQVRESYSPLADGQIVGHFRLLKDGKVGFYELTTVAQAGNSVEYRVKHFGPDLVGWEEKAEVERFRLVAVGKDVWYFDGLTIRRDGPDHVTHVVRIHRKDGSHREASLTYRRVTR